MTEIAEATAVRCGCCGEPRKESDVVRMACHPEVAVRGGCAHWLAAQAGQRTTLTPIFPVRDLAEAQDFWSRAGTEVELYDDGYVLVLVDGAEIAHLARAPGLDPAANAAACYVHVDDPDSGHARWQAAGLPVAVAAMEAIHAGDVATLRRLSAAQPPTPEEITRVFWGACHGGRRECAELLLERGAELNWIPEWDV